MKPMTKKERVTLVEKLERDLSKTAQRIFEVAGEGRSITTCYPYILVRVLPKEQKTEGGIWLAETAQNKPLYEGIVLSTWKPMVDDCTITCPCGCGYKAAKSIVRQSNVEVGDRIAFPHYEGLPVGEWLDDKYYRLVREIQKDDKGMPHCMILGKINYKGDVLIQAEIRKLTRQLASVTTSGVNVSRGADPSAKY